MKIEYKRREACFICSSPYQVIGALSILSAKKMDADLYIPGSFPDHEKLAEKIRNRGLFANVCSIDLKAIGVMGKGREIREIVFPGRTVGKFLPDDISYDTCYLTSRASLKASMLKVLLDRNPGMKRVLFEDGMGTYSEKAHLLHVSPKRRFLEKVLGWDIDDPANTSIMAYLPELVQYPAPYDTCPVVQMPRLALNDENREMLEDVFSVTAGSAIRERYILFDTKRHGPSLIPAEEMALLDRCFAITAECAGKENAILKPHPRSTQESPCGVKMYPHKSIPMEVLYASMTGLESRVLVTFVSTAVFTPKILFDAESIVICLHRICRNNKVSRGFEQIYENFRGTYKDPGRVMAPESPEELREILLRIRESDKEQ